MSNYYLYCKKADFKQISETFHISPMLARIIRNRDLVSEGEIEEYLNGGTERLNDPFLMKGIKEAVPLIFDTIKKQESIRIIGDYDTDGVCSSYILKSFIRFIGGTADIRLPDRMAEGYGMNPEMAKEAATDGVKLIITCDNGVSSYEAVEEAKNAGIKVIVSDHHEVPLPIIDADVVIDAKQPDETYPYKELCGAGVAFKLVCALYQDMYQEYENTGDSFFAKLNQKAAATFLEEAASQIDQLLQFAGIATIADVVPLTGENRILAKEGIKRLRKTENIGLRSLMETRHIHTSDLSSYHIGFILAPCLNSAGRLKNADIALHLLEEKDPFKADAIARELSDLNEDRKAMTMVQTQTAEGIVSQLQKRDTGLPKILVLYLPDAHESIAGIIAGRLKELYGRPVIVVTDSEDGLKGSGRSVDVYNMVEELRKQGHLFEKLGGHAKAAGFSLKTDVSAQMLSDALNTACDLTEEQLEDKQWIDMQLPFQYISESFINELDLLEPFGLKNERPVFAEKNIKIHKVIVLGKNNNVLKLQMENEAGYVIEGIRYGAEEKIASEADLLIKRKETDGENYRISFTYYPSVNEFRGEKTLQVRIMDFITI